MTDQGPEVRDERETTRGELEELKQEKEALTKGLDSRNTIITRLEQNLASKDSEVIALKQAAAEAEKKLTEVNNALAQAVTSYKALVVKSNPGILAEMITGDTVDGVNTSLENAQVLINRVRQEMEAEASKTKIPAGAPQRAPLDLSALSPREKIQYAIGGKR